MLSHERLWFAIDALAARHRLTLSGLARKAGLDPTTFHKSRRVSVDGRLHWPSTETLAKAINAIGASLDEFMLLVARETSDGSGVSVPFLLIADVGGDHIDDRGAPKGASWDKMNFPGLPANDAYALEVSGSSMLPLFRDGDILICSPSASVRRGDRVVVRTVAGEVMVTALKRRTANLIELVSFKSDVPDLSIATGDVSWLVRVLWASQ